LHCVKTRGGAVTTRKFDRGDHAELAAALLQDLAPHGHIVYDEGEFRVFNGRIWAPVQHESASLVIQGYAGASTKTPRGRRPLSIKQPDVAGAIKLARDRVTRRDFFASRSLGLAFADCFVEVSSSGLGAQPLEPDQACRVAYEFPLNERASCNEFEDIVAGLFRDDPDGAAKAQYLQESFGAALVGIATKYQQCAMLLGEGSNGKDTILEVLQNAFPDGSVVTIPPRQWGKEYYLMGLSGALLNVVAELPAGKVVETDMYKAVTGGSWVTARSPFEPVFRFRPTCGHVYALNKLQQTADLSHGFFRRHCIIQFNRVFQDHEKDRTIPERMAKQRPAIVMWMLRGAIRLLTRGHFEIPASSRVVLDAWRKDSDTVRIWYEETLRIASDGEQWSKASGLYGDFRRWCDDNGHRAENSNAFAQRLRSFLRERKCPEPKRSRDGIFYPLIPLSARTRVASSAVEAEKCSNEADPTAPGKSSKVQDY
jgi:P4 family phage/plasmid primase-like protien